MAIVMVVRHNSNDYKISLAGYRREAVAPAGRASARSVGKWIVLLAGAGLQNQQIAAVLKITTEKAARWRNRFLDGCLETTQEKPPNTHWSTRTMAEAAGLSEKSVRRVWRKYGLKPHLAPTFGSTAVKKVDRRSRKDSS